jgi:hydrogenase/urease accessory protein HupE
VIRARFSVAIGIAITVACIVLLVARVAHAHTLGLSSGRYVAAEKSLAVDISFSAKELSAVCPTLDADRDGQISPAELAKNEDCLDLAHTLVVTADGAPCPAATPIDASLTEGDGVLFHLVYACASRPVRFQVEDGWLAKFGSAHRHVARAEGEKTDDRVLDAKNRAFEVVPPPASASARSDDATSRSSTQRSEPPRTFFGMGFVHILTGFDHLAFLLGLLLGPAAINRRSARDLLYAVTAFSIGHSISLALSVSGAWVPSGRIVEPLIAVSIAFIGVENLVAKWSVRRWLVTLPFGFVHGFGFADALRRVLPGQLGVPLLTFNLGVEAGQIVALAPMVGLLVGLRAARVDLARPRRVASALVFAGGVVLLVARIASP